MGKIRSASIRNDYAYVNFEIHYSAKLRCFVAKKLPDFLALLEGDGFYFRAVNEAELEKLVKQKLAEVEASATEWRKTIVYTYKANDSQHSTINLGGGGYGFNLQRDLGIEYKICYIQKVAGKEFYMEQGDYERCERSGHRKYPQSISPHTSGRIKYIDHTPELEAFFESIMAAMSELIKQVDENLSTPENIIMLANSGTNLLTSGESE